LYPSEEFEGTEFYSEPLREVIKALKAKICLPKLAPSGDDKHNEIKFEAGKSNPTWQRIFLT